jgi:hypothetical protein
MLGPLLVAPALLMTSLTAYAAHPRFGRVWVIATILAAGIALPWTLELAGVLASTYHFDNGALVLVPPAIELRAVPVTLALALIFVALLAAIAWLSRAMALRQRAASRRAEIQAWHLRQLIPEAAESSS